MMEGFSDVFAVISSVRVAGIEGIILGVLLSISKVEGSSEGLTIGPSVRTINKEGMKVGNVVEN